MRSVVLSAVISLFIVSLLASPAFADNEPWWLRCEKGDVSTGLTIFDNAPEFSAINGESKTAVIAQIQVSTDNNWDSPVWNSGNVSIYNTYQNVKCQDIEFGCQGSYTNLAVNTQYFWRIRFFYTDDSASGWSCGRFLTGDEFKNYKIYFTNSYTEGSWPYGSPETACNDLSMLGEIVAALNGDNNSNPKNYTTSNYNLVSRQNKFRIVLKGGTHTKQVIVPGNFDGSNSSATYHITIQNNTGETPIVNPGVIHSDLHRVIINANYTQIIGITACGASSEDCAGFYTNRSYVEFSFCNASNNDHGFIIGGEEATASNYVKVYSCTAQNNDAYSGAGVLVRGGAKWTDIYNCSLFGQAYGIHVEPYWLLPEGSYNVDCCTVRSNSIYNNTFGVYFYRSGSSCARDCEIKEFNRIYDNYFGVYVSSGPQESASPLVIKNNLIYRTTGTGTGIYLAGTANYVKVLNNTLYKTSYGIYQQNASCSSRYTIKNNIICVDNNSSYYGIYCEATGPFISCDYNDIFLLGSGLGKTGYFDGSARTTLADWQSASPYDDNSISLNPRLVNPSSYDFHLKSMAGHWDEATQEWMNDSETSECIDRGDPTDSYANEPSPNGGRINIGCYGSTAQASKSWDNSGVSIQEPEFTTKQLPNSDHASDAAYADVNRDGLLDIYLARINGDNRLYLQCENGDFIDVAASAGVTNPQYARSARFADLDMDGDFDLIVTCDTSNQSKIYINKFIEWGNVSFTSGATGMNFPANATAIAYFDLDNDNDLDVYIGTSGTTAGRLFRNNFDGYTLSFSDVSVNAGNLYNVKGVFDIAVLDVNTDGWYDLFISRPDNADMLLFNDGGGSFTDDAAYRGVNHGAGSRGARAADFNGDGYVDIFLGLGDTDNNILYINDGYGSFTDLAASAGVNFVRANGVAIGDFSADGKDDIYVSSPDGSGRLFSHKETTNAEFWNIGQIKGVEGPAYGTGFPKAALLDRNSTIDLILPSTGAANSVVCLGKPAMQVESRLVSQLDNATLFISAKVNNAAINPANVYLEFNGKTFYPASVDGSIVNFSMLCRDTIPFGNFTLPRLAVDLDGNIVVSRFDSIQMYGKNTNNVPSDVYFTDNQGTICFVVNDPGNVLTHSLDTYENCAPHGTMLQGTLSIRASDTSKADIFSPYENQWKKSITIPDIPLGQT
jgi:hypothetical protein